MTDDLIRLPTARRLEIRLTRSNEKLAGAVAPGPEQGPQIAVLGALERGGDLEALLGARGRSDEELIRSAYDRFGWGGLVRLSGPFAAAIADTELVLARSPTFGAERAIYLREMQDSLQFSTDPSDVRGAIDADALRSWLVHRLWMPRSATPFRGVTQVEAGGLVIASRDRIARERFWTFTPFGVPRLLPEEEAQREVEEMVARALARAPADAELLAEAPALELFRAHLSKTIEIGRARDFQRTSIERAYRALAWPVPLSQAAEVAALMRSDRPLVTDLGMRELLGATETGLGAYVESVSSAVGLSPSPSTLIGAVRAAAPIDRRLVRSRLLPSLVDGARLVGNRWKRHLPPTLADRLALEPPRSSLLEPVSGDRFVDRRFAEALDPGLAARHRAIASVRRVIAPFLDLRLVELLFSLPKAHFVDGGRIMRIVRGGAPLAPFSDPKLPRYPDDHPYRSRPRRWLHDLERDTDDDRWLGLGAFLETWGD